MKNPILPILPIVHKMELELNRRLTDKEYDDLLVKIEREINMINLNNWVEGLPKEVIEGIKNM